MYTIGHKSSYLKAIKNSPDNVIQKLGKRAPCKRFPNGYEGGYVFRSIEEAQRRIDEKYPMKAFIVFGLKGVVWETDVERNQNGGWWHNLLKDAEITILSVI